MGFMRPPPAVGVSAARDAAIILSSPLPFAEGTCPGVAGTGPDAPVTPPFACSGKLACGWFSISADASLLAVVRYVRGKGCTGVGCLSVRVHERQKHFLLIDLLIIALATVGPNSGCRSVARWSDRKSRNGETSDITYIDGTRQYLCARGHEMTHDLEIVIFLSRFVCTLC